MVLEDYYEPNWLMIALTLTWVIFALLAVALIVVAVMYVVKQRRGGT